MSQPPIAKIADYFGRLEAYFLCAFLYAIGRAIAAAAPSIYAYAVGNSIYMSVETFSRSCELSHSRRVDLPFLPFRSTETDTASRI